MGTGMRVSDGPPLAVSSPSSGPPAQSMSLGAARPQDASVTTLKPFEMGFETRQDVPVGGANAATGAVPAGPMTLPKALKPALAPTLAATVAMLSVIVVL